MICFYYDFLLSTINSNNNKQYRIIQQTPKNVQHRCIDSLINTADFSSELMIFSHEQHGWLDFQLRSYFSISIPLFHTSVYLFRFSFLRVVCSFSLSLSLSPVFHLSIDGVPGVHGINQLLFLSVSFPVAEGRGEERQTQGKSLECHHIHQLTHTHT